MDAAVALGTVDPSARWFHDWFATADVIGFPSDRDWYLGHGSSPSFSTMIGVWSPTGAVVEVLDGLGTVVFPGTERHQPTTLREFT